MSIRLLSVMSPLLDDSRLTIPEMKVGNNLGMAVTGLRTAYNAAGGGIRGAANAVGSGIGATARATKDVLGQGVRGVAGSAKELAKGTMEGGKSMVSGITNGVAGPAPVTAAAAPIAAAAAPVVSTSTNPPTAPGSLSHVLQNLSMPKAMGYGALAGAAKGLIDPGTYTDENGNVQQKSRVGAMVGNAATGAALGGVSAPLIRGGARMHAAMPKEDMAGSKVSSFLPIVGPTLKSASAPGNLDATTNPMIAGVPTRSGDNGDSGGQITMDASTAKISAKTEKNTLDASMNVSIDNKDKKPGSKPFELPSLNLSKNQPKKK